MLVTELEKNGHLPESAGLAKLSFESFDYSKTQWKGLACHEPRRCNDHIVITHNETTQYFPLLSGQQFVLITAYNKLNFRAYFGGTDERPFLVSISHTIASKTIGQGNEQAFFDSLKPKIISAQEKFVGLSATKRQGDIFAVKAPFSWNEQALVSDFIGLEQSHEIVEKSLFGTRHIITGKVWGDYWNDRHHNPRVLFEGVLAAPDHTSLQLIGVHFLAQAEGLMNPEQAD